MLRRFLKILLILAIMWAVSLLTIVKEFQYKNGNKIDEQKMFDEILNNIGSGFQTGGIKSRFKEWQNIGPATTEITKDDLHSVVQNYDGHPGEMGKPVLLAKKLRGNVRTLIDQGWEEHSFNQFVSDLIPVNRTLPDPRHEWCKQEGRYSEYLPNASVIICFHNEAWSTLLRTVHSVINRSPERLLAQIVLVDDFSTMPHLKEKLETYMEKFKNVKIVRTRRREGLIRARILGAKHAEGKVLVFLDSHCECADGWLEPLLDRIRKDRTIIASPVVDLIHDSTFEYVPQGLFDLRVGGFDWDLKFIWRPIPIRELNRRKHIADPIHTPAISGGLFAVRKYIFYDLGYYDKYLDIWGGENLEVSLKVWMCGGSLEIVPCSHVGHVFRKTMPYKAPPGFLRKNLARVAEVWLDDYAKYYYERVGNMKIDFGNVTEQQELRKFFNCLPFQWYLDNVYPELEIPGNYVSSGQIINIGAKGRCMDSNIRARGDADHIRLYVCHSQGGNQYWIHTKDGEIKHDGMCLSSVSNSTVMLYMCRGKDDAQKWIYDKQMKHIKHVLTEKCLETALFQKGYRLKLSHCHSLPSQQWMIEKYNESNYSRDIQAIRNKWKAETIQFF